ncbi:unnamed protein product [Sphagnum balticum]
MDSLCANYTSDDEDDEDQQLETPQSSLSSSNFLESSGKPSISSLVPHSKNSQQFDSRELYPSRDKIEQHRRAAIFQDFRDVKPLSEDLEGASKRARLTALLPAPENSLGLRNALGSGSGPGGRRTAMEVVSTGGEIQMGDLYATQEVSPSLYMQYDENNWHYNGGGQTFISQSSQAVPNIVKGSGAIEEFEDPVAQVLRAKRRRGKEDKRPPPSVIEVRQADLTGGPKLRED